MARVRIEFPEPALFTHDVPVRITDLNYGNHLGHDSLVSILHEVRARFFRHFGMEESDVDGVGILLTDLAVQYKAEVFYGQVLRVEVAVADVAAHGCDIIYRVTDCDSNRLTALAKTGIAFFDYGAKTIAGVPTRFLTAVEATNGP